VRGATVNEISGDAGVADGLKDVDVRALEARDDEVEGDSDGCQREDEEGCVAGEVAGALDRHGFSATLIY
jgi:hypothetical protein